MKKKYQAFTLIESLVVLILVSNFILLPTIFFNHWQTKISEERYLSLFEKQLLYTQQMAIVKECDTYIKMKERTLLFIQEDSENAELILPEEMNLIGPELIVFKKGTGNNGKLAKYEFYWKRMNKQIIYQFQMGSVLLFILKSCNVFYHSFTTGL